MVGRVTAFQPGGQGSIPGGVRNFNSYPGIECVSFVCVLSCAVSGGGPNIVLTTHSGRPALCICLVFRSIDNCSPYRHLTHGHLGCKSRGGVSPRLGEGKYKKKQERKKESYFLLFSDIQEINVKSLTLTFQSVCLLCFTTLFNILGHQRRFRNRAWKVWQILLTGSNFGLRFFYVP